MKQKHPKFWLVESDTKSPECNQGVESSCRREEQIEELEDQPAALTMIKVVMVTRSLVEIYKLKGGQHSNHKVARNPSNN